MNVNINKIIITGNLTKDMEVRRTQTDKAVGSFTVAVNGGYKDKKTEEWVAKTCYVDCTIWDKRAEALEEYLKRGMRVGVVGKLEQRTWEGNDGKKHSKHLVNVEEVELFFKPQEGKPASKSASNEKKVNDLESRVRVAEDVARQQNEAQQEQLDLYEDEQVF